MTVIHKNVVKDQIRFKKLLSKVKTICVSSPMSPKGFKEMYLST